VRKTSEEKATGYRRREGRGGDSRGFRGNGKSTKKKKKTIVTPLRGQHKKGFFGVKEIKKVNKETLQKLTQQRREARSEKGGQGVKGAGFNFTKEKKGGNPTQNHIYLWYRRRVKANSVSAKTSKGAVGERSRIWLRRKPRTGQGGEVCCKKCVETSEKKGKKTRKKT